MSEKPKEVPQLADTLADTLIDSFTMQTLSIHCIMKFFDLRHYLLTVLSHTETS